MQKICPVQAKMRFHLHESNGKKKKKKFSTQLTCARNVCASGRPHRGVCTFGAPRAVMTRTGMRTFSSKCDIAAFHPLCDFRPVLLFFVSPYVHNTRKSVSQSVRRAPPVFFFFYFSCTIFCTSVCTHTSRRCVNGVPFRPPLFPCPAIVWKKGDD